MASVIGTLQEDILLHNSEILVDVIHDFHYAPSETWEFRFELFGEHGFYPQLRTLVRAKNSLSPRDYDDPRDWTPFITTGQDFRIPAEDRWDERDAVRFLRECIALTELHERDEFIQYKGEKVFFPEHSLNAPQRFDTVERF